MSEDLKKVWVCHECGSNFVFHSDAEDHAKIIGHKNIKKYDMALLDMLDRDREISY